MKKHRVQYFIRGGVGATLAGSGLSLAIESGFMKHSGANLVEWVGFGTFALILFMSGISLLIDAERFRFPKP